MLSGSGPTVLGLYDGPDGPLRAKRAAHALRGRGIVAHAATPIDAAFGAARPAVS